MAISGRQWYSPISGPRDRDHPELHHEDSARAAVFCALFRGPQRRVAQVSAALENRTSFPLAEIDVHPSFKFLFLYTSVVLAFTQASLAGPQVFSIKVVTSSDDQFWTNSIIIEGTHEVMLVDAQLTKTNAEKVLREIKATKKPLSIIYITHEHADHFLGLEVFKEAYPRARILANSKVVDRINKVYQEKIDKWKGILGSGATSHTVAISEYDDNFIEFENSK